MVFQALSVLFIVAFNHVENFAHIPKNNNITITLLKTVVKLITPLVIAKLLLTSLTC